MARRDSAWPLRLRPTCRLRCCPPSWLRWLLAREQACLASDRPRHSVGEEPACLRRGGSIRRWTSRRLRTWLGRSACTARLPSAETSSPTRLRPCIPIPLRRERRRVARFRRDRAPLGPRACLQDVKHAKAHGLLELEIAIDLNVGALPEVVEIPSLRAQQPVPTAVACLGKRRGHLTAERFGRAGAGPPMGEALVGDGDLSPFQARRLGMNIRS